MGMNCSVGYLYICLVFTIFTVIQQTQGRRVTICQGDTKTIKCGNKFRVLKVVNATYGRTNVFTCSLNGANVGTTNCGKKNNALYRVRQKCNTKKKCSIFSSNTVFKDPCIGTSVYLHVVYRCVRGCPRKKFQCVSNMKCIKRSLVCNKKRNCKDGSDEANCGCKDNQFKCVKSKKCISSNLVCNQKQDCSDGSDENGCKCTNDQFQCATSKKCIPKNLVCNQKFECNDKSDENGCKCTNDQFQCVTSKKCIPKNLVCNQKFECNDKSDENGCKCTNDQFQCVTSKKCIPKNLVCNQKFECNDKSDENGCPPPADGKCGIQTIKPQLDAADCPKIRIVGGCPVRPPHSWPWAVQLLTIDQDMKFSHECGAALLSPLYALTAAHCFLFESDPQKWQVIAGRHKKVGTEANNQIRKVTKIILYPRTSSNILDKDIALIKFDKPMVINQYVTPVCLPTREPREGDYCIVVGWGEVQGTKNADILKQTHMPIVDTKKCNTSQDLEGEITPFMFCAGFQQGKHDACQGDSGGPLMCRSGVTYYLQGVVSWGIECAKPLLPGVYANVFKFVAWIRQQMSIN